LGWLFALGVARSEERILHGNRSRASGFFIYFEKSAVCVFRVASRAQIITAVGEVSRNQDGLKELLVLRSEADYS
jgi:hypothetical protein